MALGSCFVCGRSQIANAEVQQTDFNVECPFCGRYSISSKAAKVVSLPENTHFRPYLSAHVRQAHERGEVAQVTTANYRTLAEGHMHTPVQRKLEMVLAYFAGRGTPGTQVAFYDKDVPLFDAESRAEIDYYITALDGRGLIFKPNSTAGYVVTPDGWAQLEPLSPGGVPGTCFVAMAFHSSLDSAYAEGIVPAVSACGLSVVRVDRIQHNGVVTDVIQGEIRRAQLVVADVTLQRQGVYFEAGFAIGLGRTVIWSCREDHLSEVHFDTRQYSHVVWTDPTDLWAKLEARIRGTVQIPVKN